MPLKDATNRPDNASGESSTTKTKAIAAEPRAGGRKPKSESRSKKATGRWVIDLKEELGKGTFGTVYRCTDKGVAEGEASVHCVAKKVLLNTDPAKKAFHHEVKMLQAVGDHEHVIKFHGHEQVGNQGWFYLALATGGDLFELLAKAGKMEEGVQSRELPTLPHASHVLELSRADEVLCSRCSQSKRGLMSQPLLKP